MVEKRNIFLVGPIRSGKSSVGRQLSKLLNMDFFDSNVEIERITGASIDWVFDLEGEKKFRIREERIIDKITLKYRVILASGTESVKSRYVRNCFFSRGIVIYLQTSIEKQLLRIQKCKNKCNSSNDNSILKVKNLQNSLYKCISLYEEVADITINTDNKNIKEVVRNIIFMLKNNNLY